MKQLLCGRWRSLEEAIHHIFPVLIHLIDQSFEPHSLPSQFQLTNIFHLTMYTNKIQKENQNGKGSFKI